MASAPSPAKIAVAVRIRPLTGSEEGQEAVWAHEHHQIWQSLPVRGAITPYEARTPFGFDRVFGERSRTADIYEEVVRERVCHVLRGYNTTVMAYGQASLAHTPFFAHM